MRTISSALTAILLLLITNSAFGQGTYATPGYYTFTVPTGVMSISFDVQGASGGKSYSTTNDGGRGARVQGNLAVTPGQVLHIYVGGGGTTSGGSSSATAGGYNGGGNGFYKGGGGGGASDIRLTSSTVGTYTTTNRVVVAGGGGGGGYISGVPGDERGGAGGQLTGESGYYTGSTSTLSSPTGGTSISGGTNAVCGGSGTSATLGEGSDAYIGGLSSGGGGGGYYGGGTGCGAGGGGGSSYAGPGTSGVSHTRGYNPGLNGVVIICTGTAGTITGNAPVCVGYTRTMSSTFGGGTWSSGSTGIATVGSSSGVVTGVSVGTATLTYTASVSGCGSTFTTFVVTVNPVPTAITGPSTVCATQTTTLSNTIPGGAWTSSNTSRATANSTSGVVTGVSAGTATISYSFGSACYVTKPITVNALSVISGLSSLCPGLTTTLTNGTSGGTWSSSNSSVATIGSTGFVTAVATGITTISYSLPSGCVATKSFTVVTTPSAISGSNNICLSATTTLTNAGGGNWTSSAPGIASIGSASGIVTGAAAGAATITYSLGTGCMVTMPFTVNAFPSISGSYYACAGIPTTFTGSGSGTWSTADAGITIGSTSGTVTGVSTGTATITYTSTTGCAATRTLTIHPVPASITGTLSACPAAVTTLSCSTAGGTWSSASTSIAIITSSGGMVNPVAAGVVDITYTITSTSCYQVAQFTVNPNPAPITGSSTVCQGDSTTLSSATPGGTWSAYPSTIGSASGVVTGVWTSTSAGVSTIAYILPTGCRASFSMTVNLPPSAGTFSVPLVSPCPGDVFTLTASQPGGVWGSTNTTLATIGAASGIVNVLAGGWDTITYSRTNLCGTTTYRRTLIILPAPDAGIISGPDSVCMGTSVLMINTVLTGIWSTTTGKAIIGSSGLLTGTAAGIDTVKYTATNSCGTTVAVKVITVNPNPPIDPVVGPNTVCEGEVIVLSNATAGGTWSSSNANATVDVSGNVTGVAAGTVTISYSLTNICTSPALHSVTVISSVDCHAGVKPQSAAGYNVYPNPSDGSFSIELPQLMSGTITITDVLGRTIETRNIETANNQPVLYFHIAGKGNYFITITTNDNSYHSKVIVR